MTRLISRKEAEALRENPKSDEKYRRSQPDVDPELPLAFVILAVAAIFSGLMVFWLAGQKPECRVLKDNPFVCVNEDPS